MNLLDSLLDAIVRLQGDALVIHAGEKPYVVTTSPSMHALRGQRAWGQVELSSRVLTHELVMSMAGQILPPEQRQALDEVGAIEHEVPAPEGVPDKFTVVAARGGDDIWLELRRHAATRTEAEPTPPEVPAESRDIFDEHVAAVLNRTGAPDERPQTDDVESVEIVADETQAVPTDEDVDAMLAATAAALLAPNAESAADERPPLGTAVLPDNHRDLTGATPVASTPSARTRHEGQEELPSVAGAATRPNEDASWRPSVTETIRDVSAHSSTVQDADVRGPADKDRAERPPDRERRSYAGSPVTTPGIEPAAPEAAPPDALLQKLLRTAVARGASTVYIVAGMRPMARVKGDFGVLEGLPVFDGEQVERILESLPHLDGDASRTADLTEWVSDVSDVGRVRCVRFRDHRGPGAIFRLVPASAVSADQLRLPDEIRALCSTDGLMLVSGAPRSGKSTLLNGIINLINHTRSDHVITVESRIQFVHSNERSFISQREAGRDAPAVAAAVRDALHEDPDVLLIEDIESAEVAAAALEAVHAGRLVVAAVSASSPADAVRQLIELFPEDERPRAQASLATELRAVVSQILVRNATGGRTAAREVLLNTPGVSALIREGRMADLHATVDSGDVHVTLDATLASLVRDGAVHVAEGYRKASDRAAFVRLLQREGIDTAFAEKLA